LALGIKGILLEQQAQIISTDPATEDLEDGVDTGVDVERRPWTIGTQQHGLRLDRALSELDRGRCRDAGRHGVAQARAQGARR
jgi:hypothetical protein